MVSLDHRTALALWVEGNTTKTGGSSSLPPSDDVQSPNAFGISAGTNGRTMGCVLRVGDDGAAITVARPAFVVFDGRSALSA